MCLQGGDGEWSAAIEFLDSQTTHLHIAAGSN